jgi:hypothetical protein
MSTPPPKPLGALTRPEHPPTSSTPRVRRRITQRQGVLIGVCLAFTLWTQGLFDRQLVDVGLNAKPCVVSPLFGTRCGKEAEALMKLKHDLQEDTK